MTATKVLYHDAGFSVKKFRFLDVTGADTSSVNAWYVTYHEWNLGFFFWPLNWDFLPLFTALRAKANWCIILVHMYNY